MERILENIFGEKDMEKENLCGKMGKYSMESGRTAKKMDSESGSLQKEITMKGSGSITDKMERAIFFI